MEGTSTSDDSDLCSSGLEWENLALYSNNCKQVPMPMHMQNMNEQFGIPNDLCDQGGRDFGYEDMMRMTGDHHHPISIGLRLGHPHKELVQQYNEYGSSDHASFVSRSQSQSQSQSQSRLGNSIPVSSTPMPTPTPTKRSRASYHNMQNPCCQVQGCNLDLKLAKDYHRRHRICDSHSKSPKVIVAGMERRFCQQCSRFHDLSEFDDKKRSCRRRLSDHNARRRRVQPESIQLTSPGRIYSALYTDDHHQRHHQNVLLNGLPVSMPNSSCWENANAMPRHSHAHLVRPSKSTTLNDDVLRIDTTDRLSSLGLHRSTPRNINLDQCLHVGSSNCSSMAPELLGAHSFLSSNSWSLHEAESTSMEGISYSQAMRHSETTTDSPHNLTLFQNTNININIGGLDQQPPAPAPAPATSSSSSSSSSSFLHMQNIASSHQQEYQLFKPPNYQYSPAGNFYSSQRS